MKYPLFVLFLALAFCANGQEKNGTLLWRITGNGLTKPSYLFGTMHLTDKRLFKFSDSLYAAIEHTDGLAIEVNLNEIIGYYINKLQDDEKDDKKLKDVLSKSELDKVKGPLSKKLNKDINDITTRDILKEKNKWIGSYMKKGEMPTFIDAYLFDIAKRQGKWLGGIEDVEDQMSLVDEIDLKQLLVTDESESYEKMIDLYIKQDLDGINNLVNSYDPRSKDLLLTKRNIKMARRMDSLSALRSMFFAVGAAHLPGDSGVISLLRVRGFTVEPVFSDKKIFAKDYTFKEVPEEWHEVVDSQSHYTVSMPGIPSSVRMYGLIDLKFLLELSNLSGFCTMAFLNPGNDERNCDTLYETLAKRMFSKKKINKPNKISQDGVAGVEYIDNNDNNTFRLQMFQKGNITYLAWMFGKKEAYIRTKDAEHFFSSLRFTADTGYASHDFTFVDSQVGVTFNSPVKVEFNGSLTKQNSSIKGWDAGFYTGQDSKSGAYIMFVPKQVKAGNYIVDDSVVLQDIYTLFSEKYSASKKWTYLDGYRAIEIEGGADNVYMKVFAFVRGNKTISLMLITKAKTEDPNLQQIFSSFHLLPFNQKAFMVAYDSARTFSTPAPGPFRIRSDEKKTSELVTYFSFDTLTATCYSITVDTLSKYAWSTNDSALMDRKMNGLLSEDDSILSAKFTEKGADISKEVLVRHGNSNVYKRERILLHGNIRYNLFASGDKQELENANTDQFFSAFQSNIPVFFDLHEHKGRKLFDALKTGDSLTRCIAYNGLDRQEFATSDLPMLHEALFQRYAPVYDWGDNASINKRTGNVIVTMGDTTSLPYIKQNYASLNGEREDLKYVVLNVLAGLKTKESYDVVADLFVSAPPRKGSDNSFYDLMTDSLSLLHAVYPSMSKLISDTSVGMVITRFASVLYDSGLIKVDDLKRSESEFIKLAGAVLPGYLHHDKYETGIYNLLYMLYDINTPASLSMLRQFLPAKNIYVKRKAAIMLAARNQKVPDVVWETLAANSATRVMLYTGLQNISKESLFPAAYHTQKYFADSYMYGSATDAEDMEYVAHELVSTRTQEFRGSKCKFYLYKISYTSGGQSLAYLGIAGSFELNGKSVEPIVDITGVYLDNEYSESTVSDLFDAYLEQYRKNDSGK